jgi:ketosteroid isomerase-like protein
MPTPQSSADELLETDRRFGLAARETDGVTALAAMLDDSVVLPVAQRFAEGREAAVSALRENPQNAASRLEWAPIRAGVSADGQHGFTFGFMTQRVGDSTHSVKYLAYWVKRADGWRVLTYRRRRAAAGPRNTAMMAPSVAAASVAPTGDPTVIASHRASLAAAEQAFSDSAQIVGLQAAFESFGHPDAVNLGGPGASDFVVGSPAIGRAVGAGSAGQPSPVSWKADHGVVVASSGDLGVTFGYIRPNATDSRQPARGSPFFTIWRRASRSSPWRYIAE